jgi:hypothetical protein
VRASEIERGRELPRIITIVVGAGVLLLLAALASACPAVAPDENLSDWTPHDRPGGLEAGAVDPHAIEPRRNVSSASHT